MSGAIDFLAFARISEIRQKRDFACFFLFEKPLRIESGD